MITYVCIIDYVPSLLFSMFLATRYSFSIGGGGDLPPIVRIFPPPFCDGRGGGVTEAE